MEPLDEAIQLLERESPQVRNGPMLDLPLLTIPLGQQDIGIGEAVENFGHSFKKHGEIIQRIFWKVNENYGISKTFFTTVRPCWERSVQPFASGRAAAPAFLACVRARMSANWGPSYL